MKSLSVIIQMKATKQVFPVVLFITTRWFQILSLWIKFKGVTTQTKATKKYFATVKHVIITLKKKVLGHYLPLVLCFLKQNEHFLCFEI